MPHAIANPKNLLAVAVIATSVSLPAHAQDGMLEEVIVTAQKRAEDLQDTAIAITAISASSMDDLNISSSEDYEAMVPSLSVRNSPNRLFLRGIGRVTNALGTEPGVAVYLDQIYTSEIGVLNRASSLTTQQLDVLRGPQGTLFGRNATGGAVSVTSKRPTQEFEHEVRATAGNYGEFNWGGASSGPITDTLGYRVHAYGNSHDGYVDNQGGNDIFDQDHTGYGAQLSWDATNRLNIWVSWASDRTDDHSSGVNYGGYLIKPYLPGEVTQDGFLYSEQYQWDKENPTVKDRYKTDQNDVLKTKNYNNNKYITHVSWDLDAATVKYIGAYFEGDFSGKNGDLGMTSNPDVRTVDSTANNVESYSHELQLLSASDGPLQWVAGLYYYHSETHQPYTISSKLANYLENTVPSSDPFNLNAVQPNLNPAVPIQYQQNANLDVDSYAAYADGNYSFNDQWKLTLGIRYSYDEKEGSENQYAVADPYALGLESLFPVWDSMGFPANCCGFLDIDPQVANRKLDDDWDNVSGRIVLDYMYSDDQMMYASISSGYKAGGFRLGSIQPTPSFDEEKVVSYEIGYKGTFADVLRVNAAAYFYDYNDMQVVVPYLNNVGLPVLELVNADESEVKGFELEATWLATDSLTLMANYSYIDGEYTDFCCFLDTIGNPESTEEQDLSGNPLTQAPKNKIFTNASYSWVTDSMGEFVLSGSYSWIDERQYDVYNTDATLADSYYRVDASLNWFSPSQDLRVIVSGKNLTDEETWTSLNRVNAAGSVFGAANAPLTYSLEVQYSF